MMSPVDILISLELLNLMPVSQKIILGLEIAGLGMTIVFTILIILMICLNLMKKFFYKTEDKKLSQNRKTENLKDKKKKIIAVIISAILAGYYKSDSQFKIRQIEKNTEVKENIPIWGRIVRGGGNIINEDII